MEYTVTELSPNLNRVTLSGRGDAAGIDKVETAFTAVVGNSTRSAVLDLSAVPFMGSLGIRMLLSCGRVMARRGAKMVIFGVQPAVMEVFEIMALPKMITIAPDEETARTLVGVV